MLGHKGEPSDHVPSALVILAGWQRGGTGHLREITGGGVKISLESAPLPPLLLNLSLILCNTKKGGRGRDGHIGKEINATRYVTIKK